MPLIPAVPSVTIAMLAAWGLLLAASGPAAAQVGPWPMLQQNLGHTGLSPLLGPVFGVHRIEIRCQGGHWS
jgi:hypothetical protein